MKKGIAIILLGLQLFNMGGYQLLFKHFEEKSSSHFIEKLDNHAYNETELIEIKVPISLPYQSNWDSYQRYDGEVVINGVHFNYVKRKLVNDSMSFLCIPNKDKMDVIDAGNVFYALVNDLQGSQRNHEEVPSPLAKLSKIFFTEYSSAQDFQSIHSLFNNTSPGYQHHDASLLQRSAEVPERPPLLLFA
jgi:hypothetical protein